MRRQYWAILAVLLCAAALRVAVNNVTHFLPYDEGTYVRTTQQLLIHGWGSYPEVVRSYIADSRAWVFPDPLRYGWYAATTLACAIQRHANGRALANLSTFASILAVFLTWLLARELVDESSALTAAALSVTSPLQLALGRRALQDEFFCAAVLLSLWCVARASKSPPVEWPAARHVAAALSLAFMLSVKESGLFVLPAALALVYAIKRKIEAVDAGVIVAAIALYFAGFVIVARDAASFFRIFQIVRIAQHAPYVVQFQGGPPHRLLIDLLTLAPVVFVLAIAALARRESGPVAWPLAATLVVFSCLSKNLRFIVMADPLMRVAAAPLVARRPALLFASAATELLIFFAVFIQGDVYDPVTAQVMRALFMTP
jgi:4-amino-4-deoxy-L-arabinose transferase-like glycosyltransferase